MMKKSNFKITKSSTIGHTYSTLKSPLIRRNKKLSFWSIFNLKITKITLLLIIFTCYSVNMSTAVAAPAAASIDSSSKLYLYGMLDQWINRINLTLLHLQSNEPNVTTTCLNHMNHLLNGASERHAWALKSKL